MIDEADIQAFLAGQVETWNRRDRESFFALHRRIAPGKISLDYVGKARFADGWSSLQLSWDKHQPYLDIEEVESMVIGNEAICYNINRIRDRSVRTFEQYRFDYPDMHARYFLIDKPAKAPTGASQGNRS